MARLPMSAQDAITPGLRDAARQSELERRIATLEEQSRRGNYGWWTQSASTTAADGMFYWDVERTNTDPTLFKRVAYGGRANDGGIQIMRSGLYFVSANLVLGGNLTANTRYDINFRINNTLMDAWMGHTETLNGYFKAIWSQPYALSANDVINMYAPNAAAQRFGGAVGEWTNLWIFQLSG